MVAPAETAAFGGAALVIDGPIRLPTRVEGLQLRGRDALDPGAPAIGIVVSAASARLTLRDCACGRAAPARASTGEDGAAGQLPTTDAGAGQAPRAALENGSHLCLEADGNLIERRPRRAQRLSAAWTSRAAPAARRPARCRAAPRRPARTAAAAPASRAWAGSAATTWSARSRPAHRVRAVCAAAWPTSRCPIAFQQAQPGASGVDGVPGALGLGCTDALGDIQRRRSWRSGLAGDGALGTPGRGAGGGGGGGGARMNWIDGAVRVRRRARRRRRRRRRRRLQRWRRRRRALGRRERGDA